jgi:hypothetical protein
VQRCSARFCAKYLSAADQSFVIERRDNRKPRILRIQTYDNYYFVPIDIMRLDEVLPLPFIVVKPAHLTSAPMIAEPKEDIIDRQMALWMVETCMKRE